MDIFVNVLMAICILCGIIAGGMLIWIIARAIRNCFLNYKTKSVTVTVVNKRYVSEYTTTTMMQVGKTMIPQMHLHPEEYNVYVKWRNEVYRINDKAFFEIVKKDDIVVAKAHIGYNKKGVEKDIYLTAT